MTRLWAALLGFGVMWIVRAAALWSATELADARRQFAIGAGVCGPLLVLCARGLRTRAGQRGPLGGVVLVVWVLAGIGMGGLVQRTLTSSLHRTDRQRLRSLAPIERLVATGRDWVGVGRTHDVLVRFAVGPQSTARLGILLDGKYHEYDADLVAHDDRLRFVCIGPDGNQRMDGYFAGRRLFLQLTTTWKQDVVRCAPRDRRATLRPVAPALWRELNRHWAAGQR